MTLPRGVIILGDSSFFWQRLVPPTGMWSRVLIECERVYIGSRSEGVQVHRLLAHEELVDEGHDAHFGITQNIVDLQSNFLAFILGADDIHEPVHREKRLDAQRLWISRRPPSQPLCRGACCSG